MAADRGYSGACEIGCAEGRFEVGVASLVEDDQGLWYGRLTCAAIDWFAEQRRSNLIAIRLPNGATAAVAVTRFTYLLPAQAHVTGTGPPPWSVSSIESADSGVE